MKIAFIGGSWSSNIGNAFYNLGTFSLFEKMGNIEASFVPDPPHWKEFVSGDFDLIGSLNVDVVILTGPCLNLNLLKIYRGSFQKLRARNVKIGFLSAGMSLYDNGEADIVAAFLKEFNVSFVFTRDADTYGFYADRLDCTVYDGLCTSMYLNEAVQVPDLALGEYYVMNFDGKKEPWIRLAEDERSEILAWKKKSQDNINGAPVIRTNNLSIADGYKVIYRKPNVYHSDIPYGYFPILKHARAVFSERVHTCAATLILGGRAQYIPFAKRAHEKRFRLFERIGVPDITERLQTLDMGYINSEKEKMRNELKNVLLNLG